EGSIKSSLIPHIVKIASDLNLKVVAEGIENQMQENELRELGVEFGQGWRFGKPMKVKNLASLIESKRHEN
ncbi:MAG: sensor c-di-GMP phosphodiesterase-like protein, partial [Reinekea sp.]